MNFLTISKNSYLFIIYIGAKSPVFCKNQKVDENQNPIEGEYQYSLRYTEFIPILHAKIKQLEKEIYELKNK